LVAVVGGLRVCDVCVYEHEVGPAVLTVPPVRRTSKQALLHPQDERLFPIEDYWRGS
jgi:hypothetical protein